MRKTAILKALVWVGVIGLLLRASDYLTGDATSTGVMEVPQETTSWWGVTCLAAAVLIIAGMISRSYRAAALGAVVAAAAHTMFMLFALVATVFTPPVDDWRHPGAFLVSALSWWILALWLHVYASVVDARREGAAAWKT